MWGRKKELEVLVGDEVFAQLADELTSRIYNNLNFNFDYAHHHYVSVSAKMRSLIQSELLTFLGQLTLTSVQNTVLAQSNLKKLAADMAGTLKKVAPFYIVDGTGITTTGLTTDYFNALSCNMKEFIQDSILQDSVLNPKTPHLWYEDEEYCGGRYYANATYDVLTGSVEKREKAVLASFMHHLLLLASPEHYSLLCQDLLEQKNPLISQLRHPRHGINSWIAGSEEDTNSYVNYKNMLFGLMCYSRLLFTLVNNAKTLNNKFHVPDISNQIGLFFGNKEAIRLTTVLPLVNKAMAKAKEDEMESLKKSYLRK